MTIPRRLLLLALSVGLLALLGAGPAAAHPLGNFTTNTSAAVLPGPAAVEVVYVVDLAEVPTQQARGPIADAGGLPAWAAGTCDDVAVAQQLRVEGAVRPLAVERVGAAFLPGEAGLETLRVRCDLTAEGTAEGTLGYTDTYLADRLGWREVLAAGDGVALAATDVPSTSRTDQLRQYPTAEVSTVTTATLEVTTGPGDPEAAAALRLADTDLVTAEAPTAGGLEGLVDRYTSWVADHDLTVGFVLLAVLLAIVLGTAHAVAPGHGKTVIAAYLLGEGGHARQAVALGTTVAITHTIGVLALGVVVQTSTAFAPDSLYPLLGAVGGILFTLLGVGLLWRALRRRGHTHDHAHHHGPGHHHGHGHHHDHGPAPTGWKALILPGLAGGMVPSPSALLVLLGGIAIGRAWFGVVLVLAYGVGMALALVGAGFLLQRVRLRVAERLESATWARISAALPLATSSLIILGGLVIVARSVLLA